MKDADERDIRRYNLRLTHTAHNGDQYYSSLLVRQEDYIDYRQTEYFYRAMTLAEFDSYRTQFSFRQGYGHQGWAPFRSYSHAYLDANQSRLVEVHLPGFVQAMADQGWFTGKVERGCLSWGIGTTQSNGWQGRRGMGVRNKNDAQHPWEIFHDCLDRNHVRLVTLYADLQ
jgi:hypothetical protein